MARDLGFSDGPVSPTDEQLEALKAGPSNLVTGPCPRCRHQASHQLAFSGLVIAGTGAGEGVNAPQLMRCNCSEQHKGRLPVGQEGCGAWWVCRAVSPDGKSFTFTSERDQALQAALSTVDKAVAETKSGFAAAAEKWIPGVSALTAVAGLAAVVLDREALAGLEVPWRIAAFVLVVLAIACAALAVFTAYLAAFGLGRTLDLSTAEGVQAAAKIVNSRVSNSAKRLNRAVVLAAVSILVLLGGFGVLLFGGTGSAQDVRVSYAEDGDGDRPAEVCGRLVASEDGTIRLLVTDGAAKRTESISLADARSLTSVADCGGG